MSCVFLPFFRFKNALQYLPAQLRNLIPQRDITEDYLVGSTVAADVVRVRPDGKLDLALRKRLWLQMDEDIRAVEEGLERGGGVIPFGEKVPAEVVFEELHLSKNAFKRALGRMLKQGRIRILPDRIERIGEPAVTPEELNL